MLEQTRLPALEVEDMPRIVDLLPLSEYWYSAERKQALRGAFAAKGPETGPRRSAPTST